jgi:predicted nucleotidyltransferase
VIERELPPAVREVLDAAGALPAARPAVVAIALVGSWARSAGRDSSDVDLVVLTTSPEEMLNDTSWFSVFGEGVQLVRSEDFGWLQERRLRRPDGLEVEVCVGAPRWAQTDPLDPGSVSVAGDGLRILFDPYGLLAVFARAVG